MPCDPMGLEEQEVPQETRRLGQGDAGLGSLGLRAGIPGPWALWAAVVGGWGFWDGRGFPGLPSPQRPWGHELRGLGFLVPGITARSAGLPLSYGPPSHGSSGKPGDLELQPQPPGWKSQGDSPKQHADLYPGESGNHFRKGATTDKNNSDAKRGTNL